MKAITNHEFEKTCKCLMAKQAMTKGKHPCINGNLERLNQTFLRNGLRVSMTE